MKEIIILFVIMKFNEKKYIFKISIFIFSD